MIGGGELHVQHDSDWDVSVRQIGQEIRALREAQGMTLESIHLQTKVPIYHMRSLEKGELERLPDPIFQHGFIQKICQALGPEGKAMLAHLPKPSTAPVVSVLNSGQSASSGGLPQLNVTHLYLGYGVLLAGAVGGLAWSGQIHQPDPRGLGQAQGQPAEAEFSQIRADILRQRRLAPGPISGRAIAGPAVYAPEFS